MILWNQKPSPKIVFAATPDRPFFSELWHDSARNAAEKLGFEVTLVEEASSLADRHWDKLLEEADGVITTWMSPRIDRKILHRNRRLRIVGHAAGSVADYVSPELFDAGIKVTTANDLMAQAVADWCLTMTLVGLRRLTDCAGFAGRTELRWDRRAHATFIQEAKIGICGFGAVAAHLLPMLAPLRCREIMVHSGHLSAAAAAAAGMRKVELEELFSEADAVVLLNALTAQTIHLIGRRELSLLRDGAVLINGGRGKLIEEQALYEALAQRRFTAIFDVYHQEPPAADCPLLTMPNVILTPHNAGRPSRSGYIGLILEEFHRFFSGEPLRYEITRERAGQMSANLAGDDLAKQMTGAAAGHGL
jgi:phosphoglycerate dehydrogenase-like enzyme